MFTVPSYDVSITFIERILDERRCLYDMRDSQRDYVKLFEHICQRFQLHNPKPTHVSTPRRHLYDMRDSPRGYTKLFESICQSFHFTQLMCLRQNSQRDHQESLISLQLFLTCMRWNQMFLFRIEHIQTLSDTYEHYHTSLASSTLTKIFKS